MSENKIPLELFDIIYVEKLKTAHIDGYSGRWIIDRKGNEGYTPYILKSKYDTLLKEKEELEKANERLKKGICCPKCNTSEENFTRNGNHIWCRNCDYEFNV